MFAQYYFNRYFANLNNIKISECGMHSLNILDQYLVALDPALGMFL